MDPNNGRLAFNLAMVFLVLDLIALPFVEVNSTEFFIAIAGILILVLFMLIVYLDVRREVKLTSV